VGYHVELPETPETAGSSDAMRQVYEDVDRVAPTDFTVLLTGETGSGKEVVARAIHRRSLRVRGPFVALDCGSIPASLIEGELFGHEKGSFTGADQMRPGKFELASGGTLFLDEISNLPVQVQPKLLRALQERRIWRVGATQSIAVDIRVIAAANQPLASLIETGGFRRDLYHRLNEFDIIVPPLRHRGTEVLCLAEEFRRGTNVELKKNVYGISSEAIDLLLAYRWPGNVRELRNVIRRAVLMADAEIRPEHLDIIGPADNLPLGSFDAKVVFDGTLSLREMVRRVVTRLEQQILAQVLNQTHGNKAEAARLLQIDYKTVYKKTKDYGIVAE
ncbi:MAG: sigma-54 dependent transcriptional regulator, partial [Planctomycetota bacterium]|nr:sigma-54 dependent transcriptional regulator [Planctomycetota bacterium]